MSHGITPAVFFSSVWLGTYPCLVVHSLIAAITSSLVIFFSNKKATLVWVPADCSDCWFFVAQALLPVVARRAPPLECDGYYVWRLGFVIFLARS
jgi:hypothetical protein